MDLRGCVDVLEVLIAVRLLAPAQFVRRPPGW
jgi:hypothetical protein